MHLIDVGTKAWFNNASDTPIVYVVEAAQSARMELERLIRSAGWQASAVGCAEEFLACPRLLAPSCLLVNPSLPGLSGLELQRLVHERTEIPIIFVSNRPDLRLAVQAMKAGAFEFLVTPIEHDVVLKTIYDAIAQSRAALPNAARRMDLRQRYSCLSRREREVMDLVVGGRLNKQVGVELGISEITVKVHRGRVMRKMQARSIAELVDIAGRLNRTNLPRTATANLPGRR